MPAAYVLGIDLGTTNSVLAYAPLDADAPRVELLAISQLTAAGTIETRSALPSFVYLATSAEVAGGLCDVPWPADRGIAIGEFARRQGADVPQRTIGAAKSWLCHSRVDRHQPIPPWQAPEDVTRISPVRASQYFLEHLVSAWQSAFPRAPVALQQVVLTVPASFDASARELTREAALAAGLPDNLVLLEEPQSAVYAWLLDSGQRWRRLLQLDDVLLVCDVGGGTTDLTLVRVGEEGGELVLRRVAVGNHLLVGGDNMDLALAHFVAQRFRQQGIELDPWQSVSLWHACRDAKESLLAEAGPERHALSILGRGSRLIGGTVSVEVAREEAVGLLLEGFFPACQAAARPKRGRSSGFQEIGLPYEADTAVTRHVAAFLAAHGQPEQPVRPTHVLFNGGVFKSAALRDRLLHVLGSWHGSGERGPRLLQGHQDLDNAVAKGAAHYGWIQQHGGVRIRGGTARSYYVGIEKATLAVPGAPRPLQALCVVPFGMEEGTALDVPAAEVGLVVGEPAHFRFFSSPTRKEDRVGQVLDPWSADELEETDSLEATLPADDASGDACVPVRFHSRVTELGMFELWCVSLTDDKRWKLEFSVRDEGESPEPGSSERT